MNCRTVAWFQLREREGQKRKTKQQKKKQREKAEAKADGFFGRAHWLPVLDDDSLIEQKINGEILFIIYNCVNA